jgi:hypothetical protein
VSGTDAADIERIEKALGEWRQGDATLDVGTFVVHLADKRAPLTDEARDAVARGEVDAGEDVFEVLSAVEGVVVVSQSCDIVRECSKSECVEVGALIRVEDDATFEAVRKKRRLRYAYVPGLADRKLVVDLERIMTVEKAVVAGWRRIEGCRTDRERATFAEALARKRGRFAFPGKFNDGLSRFKERLKRAEGKKSPAGDLLAALDEIRVQASPDWGATKVVVFFWYLAEQGEDCRFQCSARHYSKLDEHDQLARRVCTGRPGL